MFDGLQQVGSSSPGVTIPLSGFRTPVTGVVNSTVGILAYEGDLGTTGDSATIQGATGPVQLGSATPGTPPLNARTNLFDSSITAGGATVTTRSPAFRNQLGFDADLFPLPGVLGNNQTSTQIRLTTGGDAYQPGAVTIATDLFAPRIVTSKTVDQAVADAGDTLTYTLTVQNQGEDGAENVVLSDAIPAATSYVPGSLTVNGATQTDTGGDDVGEVAGGTVTARLGTGADATGGGSLAPGSGVQTVTFRVQVDAVVPGSTIVRNVGRVDFAAETTGEPDPGVETGSSPGRVIRAPQINLVVTKDVINQPNPTRSPTTAWGGPRIRSSSGSPSRTRAACPRRTCCSRTSCRRRCATSGRSSSREPRAARTRRIRRRRRPRLRPATSGRLHHGSHGLRPVRRRFTGRLGPVPLPAQNLTNRVVASSDGSETNPADNLATATFETLPINDVYISKSVAPAELLEGGRVT